MKILLLASLLVLVSCQSEDSDNEIPSGGNISKIWTFSASSSQALTATSIDLSSPTAIKVVGVKFKSGGTTHSGNCELSGTGPVMEADQMNGHYDTTLTSGDPTTCSGFVPKLNFKHFVQLDNYTEYLVIGESVYK